MLQISWAFVPVNTNSSGVLRQPKCRPLGVVGWARNRDRPLHHSQAGEAIFAHPVRARVAVAQYDRGNPNTFSAMKFRIMWGVTGAIRVIRDSRR
jgi:hypothetical protein